MVPVVVGALGGYIKELKVDLRKIIASTELVDKVAAMMQKTVLMDSECIIHGDDIDQDVVFLSVCGCLKYMSLFVVVN